MKKNIKILTLTFIATCMLSLSAFPAYAGWEQVDGTWKYKDDSTNEFLTSKWIESTSEKGLWYYIDQNGVMAVSTTTPDGYYVNEHGEWRESSQSSSESERDSSNRVPVESHDRKSGSYESNYSDMWIEGQDGNEWSPTETTNSSDKDPGVHWGNPKEKGSSDGDSGGTNVKVCG